MSSQHRCDAHFATACIPHAAASHVEVSAERVPVILTDLNIMFGGQVSVPLRSSG
jgi:hypothetical protein